MKAAPETIKFKKRPEKRRLNKRTIEALKPPPAPEGAKPTQAWIYDQDTPRLAICVWSTGVRTWYWVGGINGRMMRYKIGKYTDVTPENARKHAIRISAQAAQGIDPRIEKRRVRDEMTLLGLFDQYLHEHAKLHKRTWRQDEVMFNCYCGSLKSRTLSSITTAAIKTLHSKVGEDHGKYTSNRILALLSTLFNFAINVNHVRLPDGNPCRGVKRFKEESRERILATGDEFKRFFDALEDEDQLFQDFFKLLLLTGARRNNVLSMEWTELNLDAAKWTIPGEKFKNGKTQTIQLHADVIQILRRRLAESKDEPWVFPSVRRNQSGHLDSPEKAWQRVCKKAKLTDLRMHDLRRTHGSWMAMTGASLPIIGKTLGHQNQATTGIYARIANIDPVKAAVDTAVAAMMAAAANGKKGEAGSEEPKEEPQ